MDAGRRAESSSSKGCKNRSGGGQKRKLFQPGGINMALVRWRPMNELDDMSRLVDEMWRRSQRPSGGSNWYPAIDVKENENENKIVAELHNMTKGDVKIAVTYNIVSVRGEKKAQNEEKNENW